MAEKSDSGLSIPGSVGGAPGARGISSGRDTDPSRAVEILEQMSNALEPQDESLLSLVEALAGKKSAPGSSTPPGAAAGGRDRSAEARLWKLEALYRTLVEQIPVVTFMASFEEETPELYISPQIEKLLGFTQKEWLENPLLWYAQLHPDDRRRLQLEFARTCSTGVAFRSEYRLHARDGRLVWVHGEAKLVRAPDGRPLFLHGVAYDITEAKEAQETMLRLNERLEAIVQERTLELARANESLRAEIQERARLEEELRMRAEQLAQADRRKDEFLAMLAHELRNPLAPIRNAVEILRLSGNDQQTLAHCRAMIDRQVSNMTRLIDDLLDVSRITRGKLQLRKERILLDPVVRCAVETSKPLIEARRHKLCVSMPPQDLVLEADSVRLEQVLANLLNNAAKYMDPGGHIWLDSAVKGQTVIIRVRDEGVGIDPELLPEIFDFFTQSQRSLDRAEGGLGIGLGLVSRLVAMHGGSISAHSDGPNRGAEFVLRLPLAQSPA
jgi:PAS domain S-box-containing protein